MLTIVVVDLLLGLVLAAIVVAWLAIETGDPGPLSPALVAVGAFLLFTLWPLAALALLVHGLVERWYHQWLPQLGWLGGRAQR